MKYFLVTTAWLLLFLSLCSSRAKLTAAAEPLKFAEPLNLASERLAIMNRFAMERAKSQNNPEALAAAEVQRDDALGQLAAAAEVAHSTEHAPIAQLYLEIKRYDDAARVARAAIDANETDLPSHFVLISTLCEAKRTDEAAAAFGQLSKLDIAKLDAKTFLRDSQPAVSSVVKLLVEAGKGDDARQLIGAWEGQLDKFQPESDTKREFAMAQTAVNTLIIEIDRHRRPQAQGRDSLEAAAALNNEIGSKKSTRAKPKPPIAVPNKPSEPSRLGSGPSPEALAARRAAGAIKSSASTASPPTVTTDALKAKIAAPKEGSGAAQAEAAEEAKLTKPAEPDRSDSITLTPSEKVLAAKRASEAVRGRSTSPVPARTNKAAKMLEEAKSRAARAQEVTVASQLSKINAKYAGALPVMTLKPMSPEERAASSEEEQLRHKEKVEKEWREHPQRQQAEAEWISALTQLATEAEAAQTIEHAGLAQVYATLDRSEEAIHHAQIALEQHPADKIPRALLIRLFLQSKRWDDAVHQWQAGLEQNPTDSEAQLVLLRALCDLGQMDESQTAYRMWLDLDVSAPDIKVYLEPVRHGGIVSDFVVKLIQSHRFAEADQALDDLLAKVKQLERLSPNQTATVFAKAVLDDLKKYVAKASTGVAPRSVKPRNVNAQ